MQYKGKEISEEMMKKAEACKSVEELMALAGENGLELTEEEAEAFLNDIGDVELDSEGLYKTAGGILDCQADMFTCMLDCALEDPVLSGVTDKNRTDA